MTNAKHLLYTIALLAPLGASAQMISLPMQPTRTSQIEETVSVTRIAVSTALAPYTVAGAKGEAWHLDGYSSFAHGDLDLSALDGKSQLTFSLWVAPETYPMMRLDENGEWLTTMAGSTRVGNSVKGGKGMISYNLSGSLGDITVYDVSGRVVIRGGGLWPPQKAKITEIIRNLE